MSRLTPRCYYSISTDILKFITGNGKQAIVYPDYDKIANVRILHHKIYNKTYLVSQQHVQHSLDHFTFTDL